MKIKNIYFIALLIVFTAASYAYGYHVSKKNSLSAKYEDIHIALANEIYIYDAILNGNVELATPLLRVIMASKFAKLIEYYNKGLPEESEYMRCVLTRKLRVLKEKEMVFSGETAEEDWGKDLLAAVTEYLATQCLGQPSHVDWSEGDRRATENK